jgi:hypothetical protein
LTTCIICNFILPHGDQAELNCRMELIKMFEAHLIQAKIEITELKAELESYRNQA